MLGLPFRRRPDISVIVASAGMPDPVGDTLCSIGSSTLGMDRIEVVISCDKGQREAIERLGAECLPGVPLRAIPMNPASNHASRLNHSLRRARGRYAFILDARACLDRECLDRHFQALAAAPGATAALAPHACLSEADRSMVAM